MTDAVDSPSDSLLAKRILVTGGASGIGRAVVDLMTACGASVAVFDRDSAALERLADGHADVRGFAVDVADPAQVAEGFAEIDDHFGGLDVLVANAGISSRYDAIDLPAQEWERMIDVNLSGVFYCCQQAARRILTNERGGSILVMGSTNGLTGHPGYVHYNASKAGVIALAKTLALELAPKVRVNAICPGYVLTDMQRAEYTDEMLAEVDRGLPIGRHATPAEVARLFAFLASDWGSYITGQAIVIDGGELA